jgi:hypothetical protein
LFILGINSATDPSDKSGHRSAVGGQIWRDHLDVCGFKQALDPAAHWLLTRYSPCSRPNDNSSTIWQILPICCWTTNGMSNLAMTETFAIRRRFWLECRASC